MLSENWPDCLPVARRVSSGRRGHDPRSGEASRRATSQSRPTGRGRSRTWCCCSSPDRRRKRRATRCSATASSGWWPKASTTRGRRSCSSCCSAPSATACWAAYNPHPHPNLSVPGGPTLALTLTLGVLGGLDLKRELYTPFMAAMSHEVRLRARVRARADPHPNPNPNPQPKPQP